MAIDPNTLTPVKYVGSIYETTIPLDYDIPVPSVDEMPWKTYTRVERHPDLYVSLLFTGDISYN